MKKNITSIVLLTLSLFAGEAKAQTWTSITSSMFDNVSLKDVQFIDDNNGFVIGYGTGSIVAKTSDGGATWTSVSFPFSSFLNELFFLDNKYGWIAGGNAIYKTTDGGATWTASPKLGLPSTGNYTDIQFLDTSVGYACNGNAVFQTLDGGNSWTSYVTSITQIRSIAVVDASLSFACGNYAGVGKMHSGVKTETVVPGTGANLHRVRFSGSNLGVLVGDSNIIVRTNNSATTLNLLSTKDTFSLTSVCTASPTHWWTVGSKGRIMASTDSGKTWVAEGVGITSQLLNNVFFRNNNLGWAVGESGVLLKYTNSTSISEQVAASKLSIFPNPASNLVNIANIVANTVVSICDLTGKTIVTKKASSSQMDMDISGFANGFYLVQASLNGQYLGQSKLIISK